MRLVDYYREEQRLKQGTTAGDCDIWEKWPGFKKVNFGKDEQRQHNALMNQMWKKREGGLRIPTF